MPRAHHRHRPARPLAALALAGVLVLPACGTGSGAAPADAAEGTGETLTITDELGREVTVDVPITAVYTDLFYTTELVRAIGAEEAIVSVDDTSSPEKTPANAGYFEEFAGLPTVGEYDEPNWEAIVESGAQVALLRRNGPYEEAIEKLEPFGIEVVVVTSWDPAVIREYLPVLGEAFGTEEQAAEAARLFDDISDLIAERTADVPPRTVYYENATDYSTGVPGSGWHDIIVDAGGENLYGDVQLGDDQGANVHNYEVDPVDIISRDPDLIVRQGLDDHPQGYEAWPAEAFQREAEEIAERPGWSGISAVRDDEIYVVNNFLLSAFGKQLGALAIATWLYPDEFADVDLDAYFDRWLDLQNTPNVSAGAYVQKIGEEG